MYQRILVPVDGSTTAHHGLTEAIRLAKLTGGRLRLIHVIDSLSFGYAMDTYACPSDDWFDALRTGGNDVLTAAQAVASEAGVETETRLHDNLKGSLHELVTAEAVSWPAEVIVLGTHGRRGFERIVMGNGAEQILRASPVPVLLVRDPTAPAPHLHRAKERLHVPAGLVAYE